LFGYGVFRFTAEYFREPDSFLGLLALNMSMGQWLCVPMIVAGAALFAWGARQRRPGT
jgi:phosphatidylglycerol:prolipoprotein diacylglycerol transferase